MTEASNLPPAPVQHNVADGLSAAATAQQQALLQAMTNHVNSHLSAVANLLTDAQKQAVAALQAKPTTTATLMQLDAIATQAKISSLSPAQQQQAGSLQGQEANLQQKYDTDLVNANYNMSDPTVASDLEQLANVQAQLKQVVWGG
jgi:hypothetical protein